MSNKILPSNTETNPKKQMKAITLRSSKQLEELPSMEQVVEAPIEEEVVKKKSQR